MRDSRKSLFFEFFKKSFLNCLTTVSSEPLSDIWETLEETESEEDLEKRHLIGNVVKASDGSFQLFADHKSHIGRNQVGCCGRKFSRTDSNPKIPEKRKNLNIRAKWKTLVRKINTERKKHLISERIAGKTYSTYAIQHKFRKRDEFFCYFFNGILKLNLF